MRYKFSGSGVDDEMNLVWTMVGDILILVWHSAFGLVGWFMHLYFNVYLTVVET